MASKVKHGLSIFQEKTVKLSKCEFVLVIFMKLDKLVTINIQFGFDYLSTMGFAMTLLIVYPQNRGGCIQGTVELAKG